MNNTIENSPIARLAGQALDESIRETWSTLSYEQLQRFQQRYAELIVAECLSIMENCDGDIDFAIWNVKKQFGVK